MPELQGFTLIADRLLRRVRERVRRGQLSEAALAARVDYSQPHIHNVLNGKRGMSFALADDLLALSNLSLPALFTQQDLPGKTSPADSEALTVTLLRGSLGAGAAYPTFPELNHRITIKISPLRNIIGPLAFQISPNETSMWPLIQPRDTIVVDTSPNARRSPDPDGIYVFCHHNRGYLGRCRLRRGHLEVRVDNPGSVAQPPPSISLGGERLLDVVRGKVIWLSREIGPPSESRDPRSR